jgi:hypothetical protein
VQEQKQVVYDRPGTRGSVSEPIFSNCGLKGSGGSAYITQAIIEVVAGLVAKVMAV